MRLDAEGAGLSHKGGGVANRRCRIVAASLRKRVSFHSRAGAFPTRFVLRKAVGPLFTRAGGFLLSALPLKGEGRSGRDMGHTPLYPLFLARGPVKQEETASVLWEGGLSEFSKNL